MARYRKIETRIWNDEIFRSFSYHAQLVFLFLLTHPHMTALGAMRASLPGLAAELGWTEKAFREAFRELLLNGRVSIDESASCVFVKNFLKYNLPENPNVVKAWKGALDAIPECPLKAQVIEIARVTSESLPKTFRQALPEPFLKSMPIPEPEPEPEYVSSAAAETAPPSKNGRDPRTGSLEIQVFRKVTSKYPPKPNYDEVILVLKGKTVEEVAPFYAEWTARGYKNNSLKWLEWLKAGAIPPGYSKYSKPEWKSLKVLREMQAEEKITKSYGKSE